MPAWHRDEGGQLNTEQVKQLVEFIMYGNWERVLQIREEQDLALEPSPPPPPKAVSQEELGNAVAQQTCAVCHSFTPGTNSPNPQAPNLGTYGTEGPFVDELRTLKAAGDQNWLKKWVTDAPAIKPGTGMPRWQGFLTEQQIDAVVVYLLSLK
jgi:mono/diheme cytochrome c family protein